MGFAIPYKSIGMENPLEAGQLGQMHFSMISDQSEKYFRLIPSIQVQGPLTLILKGTSVNRNNDF